MFGLQCVSTWWVLTCPIKQNKTSGCYKKILTVTRAKYAFREPIALFVRCWYCGLILQYLGCGIHVFIVKSDGSVYSGIAWWYIVQGTNKVYIHVCWLQE